MTNYIPLKCLLWYTCEIPVSQSLCNTLFLFVRCSLSWNKWLLIFLMNMKVSKILLLSGQYLFQIVHYLNFILSYGSDTYNPVPGVMDGVPASRNYDGGFSSKLMVCRSKPFFFLFISTHFLVHINFQK